MAIFYVNNSRWRITKRPMIYFLSKFRSYLPQKPTQHRRNEPRKEANVRRKKPGKKGKKEGKEKKEAKGGSKKASILPGADGSTIVAVPSAMMIYERFLEGQAATIRRWTARDRRRREERHVAKREAPPTFGLVRERVLDFWNADHWGPGTSR